MRNFIFLILLGFVTTMSAQSYTSRLNNLKDFNTAISKGERYKSATSSSNSSNSGTLHTDNTSHPFDPDEIINCFNCGGSGLIPFGFTMQKCHFCLGSGKQTAGKYMRNVTLPENGGYNGGNAGGMSTGTQGGASTQSRPQTAKDCGVCHGTGRCQTCNGSGRANNLMDLGTHQCVNCKSNVGKCQWCGGTGKQR